ncbi:MAG: NAD-dependent epimerase/dehydratase family protein [Planctomycetes bacterium]|nr:NAD-dependent epimerase/dehydratase family protein [Planctomycetota bacterium]
MQPGCSVVVIGGYGHIGGFLVPRLVRTGCDVTVVSRGRRPVPDHESWAALPHRHVAADYNDLCSNDARRSFLDDVRPRVVIDILSKNAPAVLRSCPSSVDHVILTGSLWMYGVPSVVPTPELFDAPAPWPGYRDRYADLVSLVRDASGPPVSAVMPPNIAGPGKIPLEPYGGRDIEVHRRMAAGGEIVLPAGGTALVGPSDAEDVAEVFALAAENPQASAGRIFNAGSAFAVSYNELLKIYGRCYGVDIPVRHGSWDDFETAAGSDPSLRFHHEAHMCPDISAARSALGYEPKFTPETSVARAVDWMRSRNLL